MPDLDQCWATIKMAESVTALDNLPGRKVPINHIDWEVQRYFQNVLGLQNYLKLNDMKYVMYNALPPPTIRKNDHHTLYCSIDQRHFLNVDSSQYYYWNKPYHNYCNRRCSSIVHSFFCCVYISIYS